MEEFEIYADSCHLGDEYESTNVFRLALTGALLEGLTRSRQNFDEVVIRQNYIDFGFAPNLLEAAQILEPENWEREGAEFLIKLGREQTWTAKDTWTQAWKALNNRSHLRAAYALAVAGLCSDSEREATSAAVTILNFMSRTPEANSRPDGDWRLWFNRRWAEPLNFDSRWPWTLVLPDPELQGETSTEWKEIRWGRYSERWIRYAVKSQDAHKLLATVTMLARWKTQMAINSSDSIVREMPHAVFMRSYEQSDHMTGPPGGPPHNESKKYSTQRYSTMIHGTWGWRGDWWHPDGDFHSYIRGNFRSDLYCSGMEFSWSGALRRADRKKAGQRLKRWAQGASGQPRLHTVFGHSYGGEVVAHAVNAGMDAKEVVLLSAPIHSYHVTMAQRVKKVIDVRLRYDLVLTLAGARQKFPASSTVVQYTLNKNFLSHSATHDPQVWKNEAIAKHVGL